MDRVDPAVDTEDLLDPLRIGEVGLVDDDPHRDALPLGKDNKPVQHPRMRLRVGDREHEHHLVRVGEDHLLGIACMPGGSYEGPFPGLHRHNRRLVVRQLHNVHAVTHSDDIGAPAPLLELPAHGGDQHLASSGAIE